MRSEAYQRPNPNTARLPEAVMKFKITESAKAQPERVLSALLALYRGVCAIPVFEFTP
jgi:hypothetical protein